MSIVGGIPYGYTETPRTLATKREMYVSGIPLSSLAAWGEPVTTSRIPGDWSASCALIRDPRGRLPKHPAFTKGAPVEVKLGPLLIWRGTLEKPDWDSGQLTAIGLCRQAEGAVAVINATLQTTSNPNSAIGQAIARGALTWRWSGSIHGESVLGNTGKAEQFDSIAQLLDAAGEQLGWRWHVDRSGYLRTLPYPLEVDPEWFITPDTVELGSTSAEQVDRVMVRYADSAASSALKSASYPATTPAGGFEKAVSLANQNAITTARATAIAKGLYDRTQGQPGWTNGVEVSPHQITTRGGQAACLALIQGGQSIRLLDLPDVRRIGFHTDVAVDEAEHRIDEEVIQLNPEGLVSDTFEAAVEEIAPGGVVL